MKKLDIVVTEKNEVCGGVLYWSASKAKRETLAQTWLAEGLNEDLLPSPATAETALYHAMESLCDRRHIVSQLPDGSGWALMAKHDESDKRVRHEQTLAAFVETDGSVKVEPASHPDAERVYDAYDKARAMLTASEIGSILSGTCQRLHAVRLRKRGGVWFVPASKLPEMEQVIRAIEACSDSSTYCLPAMHTKATARAVFAAVDKEAETYAAKVEEELTREGDSALGLRAIDTRDEAVKALRAKVAEYEALMGGSLDSVRERLENLQARLAAAALTLAAEEDKEAA